MGKGVLLNTIMFHSSSSESDFFLDSTSTDSQDFWAAFEETSSTSDQDSKKPLREKNNSKHVPHNDRPRQTVERRNARERRRVQAVNSAFVKLRSVVPIENSRGKRISKVKTLLFAIDYIKALDEVLQTSYTYSPTFHLSDYDTPKSSCCCSSDFGCSKNLPYYNK